MPGYVIDCSVLVKLVLDEGGSDEFRAWYLDHAGEAFVAPPLLASESGRVLQKSRPAAAAMQAEAHDALLANVQFVATVSDSTPIWKVAEASKLTYSDAEYVALAKTIQGILLTSDKKMAAAARRIGVTVQEF